MKQITALLLLILLNPNLVHAASERAWQAAQKSGLTPTPQYKIVIDLPKELSWQLDNTMYDNGGYYQFYSSQSSTGKQGITINYGQGISTSLTNSMQQVLDVQSRVPQCSLKKHKVLGQTKNILVFETELDQCANRIHLLEVYKVFNKSDGQYSINYTANANQVDQATILKMKSLIAQARIQHL